MKRRITILCALLVFSLCLPVNIWAQDMQLVSAEGVAAILQGDKALARDRAIEDALRKVIEQTLGTMLEAETVVNNYQVLNDSIYSKSQGYIQSYAVVKEQAGEDVYNVIVEAIVSMDFLEEDLQAINTLLRRVHNPRLMVRISFEAPGWEEAPNVVNPAESAIIKAFDNQGFDLVDKSRVIESRQEPLVDNMDTAASDVQQGAEIIIAGKAVVNKKHLPILGTMSSYQASISLTVVKADTGEVMATGSEQAAVVHMNDVTGSKQAAEKAANELGPKLVAKLKSKFNQEVSAGTVVQLVVYGVNDQQLVDLKNVLGQSVRGVRQGGIHQRFFADGVAKLDVRVKGNAQFLSDELTRKTFSKFKLSLKKFSQNKLELNFIPKGSRPER